MATYKATVYRTVTQSIDVKFEGMPSTQFDAPGALDLWVKSQAEDLVGNGDGLAWKDEGSELLRLFDWTET